MVNKQYNVILVLDVKKVLVTRRFYPWSLGPSGCSAVTGFQPLTRVTISDEAKSSTHFSVMFPLLAIGSRVARVVTLAKKILPFACKFKSCHFCYDATKSCFYLT